MAAVARDSDGNLIGGRIAAERADCVEYLEVKAILLGVQLAVHNG